jgi:hypothetical protein
MNFFTGKYCLNESAPPKFWLKLGKIIMAISSKGLPRFFELMLSVAR